MSGIQPITWSTYSPDLNPIETVRKQIKDLIERRHLDLFYRKERSFDAHRVILREAWDLITQENL